MSKLAIVIGACAVLGVAGAIVWLQRGEHVELQGRILDLRIHAATGSDLVLVVDCELTNPADVPFEVVETQGIAALADGDAFGATVAAMDTQRVLDAFPHLKGSAEIPLLKLHDVIGPGQTVRRRFALQFAGTGEPALKARRSLAVKLQERLGAVAELR
jgi:hypothetical protein